MRWKNTPSASGNNIMTLSLTLKRHRVRRNLTMLEVARLSGVSESQVSRIESGESDPTFSTVQKLCKVYKLDLGDLG